MRDVPSNERAGAWWKLGEAPEPDRRGTGRLRQETLVSNLGQVLDLSAGGTRIRTRKTPPARVVVELASPSERLKVKAIVAWTKRCGFMAHEVGLRFVGVDTATAKTLSRLGMRNRVERVIHTDAA